MTILVSHQAAPPHFTTKLHPWWYVREDVKLESYWKVFNGQSGEILYIALFWFVNHKTSGYLVERLILLLQI